MGPRRQLRLCAAPKEWVELGGALWGGPHTGGVDTEEGGGTKTVAVQTADQKMAMRKFGV